MVSLTDRVKAFLNPTPPKQKSHGNWLNQWFGTGGVDPYSGILQESPFGYAQAYVSVMAVRQAVDYYAMTVLDVPSQVVRNTTGKENDDQVVARSDDVHSDFILYAGFKHHRKTYGLHPIQAMVYNALLYDEIYAEKVKGLVRNGNRHFRVLNTLGMQFNQIQGQIVSYWYSWQDYTKTLKPDDVAYGHGYNPFEDLHGASIVQSAMSKIRIEDNLDAFLQAFFRNNATLGLVGSPNPTTSDAVTGLSLTEEEQKALKKIIDDWHISVRNSFRPLITNIPINWEVLPQPEIDKHYSISENIEKEILTAFGVNPALVGYTENTSYKEDIPQIEAQFITKRLRPVLAQIQDLINDDLLPFITQSNDFRFEFEYDGYQLITEQDTMALDIRTQKLNSGTLSLNDYRIANGDKPIPQFNDLYIYEGVPVPLAEIGNLWKAKFGGITLPASTETLDDSSADDNGDTDTATGKAHTHHHHDLSYEDYHKAHAQAPISLDDIFQELLTWKKYVEADKHLKSAFVPIHTRGDIADAVLPIEDKNELLTAINQHMDSVKNFQKAIGYAYEGIAEYKDDLIAKSIQSTRLDFELALEDLIDGARGKTIDKRAFKSRLMQNIRGYGGQAMLDGLRVGGVITELSELDDNDRATMETHFVAQRQYVNNFADTLYDKGISDEEARGKPAMWFSKSIAPLFEAGKASAMGNAMMEWVLGATEEHCKDCLRLNGQRHRMRTWYAKGWIPKSDRLACSGFNCDCKLIQVTGNARGRLP